MRVKLKCGLKKEGKCRLMHVSIFTIAKIVTQQ
jgi:hypothetical protein